MEVQVQFVKENNKELLKEILKKDNLLNSMLNFKEEYSGDLDMDNWIYLVPKINSEVAGIVLLRSLKDTPNMYDIHLALYKKFFGYGHFLGTILFKRILPCEFEGCILRAKLIPRAHRARKLCHEMGFKMSSKEDPNILYYKVK